MKIREMIYQDIEVIRELRIRVLMQMGVLKPVRVKTQRRTDIRKH